MFLLVVKLIAVYFKSEIGFKGHRCEIDVDECAEENKCQNNSTCIDDIGSYRCECPTGFIGTYCEKQIDYCSTKEFNPCQNDAKCVKDVVNNYYQCICKPGWSGQNCTINDDDCEDNMCQNGAICVDKISGYECECPVGYSGEFCEVAPNVDVLFQQTSPCQHHDCKHGVCFLPPGATDYVCKCSPGYTGKRCDQISSITFHSGSYIELADQLIDLKTKPSMQIKCRFSTKKENGVLVYLSGEQSQHLAVELFRGRIRISLNVGNYPVSTMFSYEQVNNGHYHQVMFELVKKNFTMIVDNGPSRTIVNEGENEYLDVNGPLYIGGLPQEVGQDVRQKWHIWNATSFEGLTNQRIFQLKILIYSLFNRLHERIVYQWSAIGFDQCKKQA